MISVNPGTSYPAAIRLFELANIQTMFSSIAVASKDQEIANLSSAPTENREERQEN